MNYPKRESFSDRLEKIESTTKNYYEQLNAKLTAYEGVKARASLRCVSYRKQGKLIAKMALGGKNLKLFLTVDPKREEIANLKFHPRQMSNVKAYKEVPTMFPIKSQLAVKKASQVIDMMMQ